MTFIKWWLSSIISLFLPDTCCACGRLLANDKMFLCLQCMAKLPLINRYNQEATPAMERIGGRVSCCKAASLLRFSKGGVTQHIVYGIKYKRNRELGVWCGRLLYKEMFSSGFFEDFDLLVPVPLHKKKQKKRGFNQSEAIAAGIALESGIPVDTIHLVKIKSNSSQTRKGRYERWLNSRETYALNRPEDFSGKHILIIDDVITTGSTMEACADALSNCKDLKISFLSLAISI